ncbi:short-chain dehydrogenase/reductase [Ilumatobacter sp.]|uniref:short-chain dehydrogenase/reductase n=1 Tax=Ilumatobacter sp. TaxID=1967498 RepID=UPI003B52B471
MDLELHGRHVLITGGSRGIGRACAEAFAAEGCSLALAARTAADLDAAAEGLRERHGVTVTTHPGDLSSPDDQVALVDAVGSVDVVVNNAGAIPPGDLGALDDEALRESWELKVFGYVNLCRSIVPRMVERGSGVIVNVIGAAAVRPQRSYIAGGMGNAALVALTRALGARSLRDGVRVVGVNPGLVVTDRMIDLLRASAQERFRDPERWEELVPSDPAPGRPEQIADVVAFLASPRAGHVSGTTLTLDGGASAR